MSDADPARTNPLDAAMASFLATMKVERRLPQRLIELVRLRIAFHNQCRPCMSIRYREAVADGLTEDLVCSLERPAEAADMTPAERECVLFADRFASDHLAIDADQRARLAKHLSPEEVHELAVHCAFFTGFGRMGAVFDGGDALPVGERRSDGQPLTPWRIEPAIV